MRLKIVALLGTTLAMLSFSMASHANIHTYNYVNENSTVKVLSTGFCAGKIPPFYKYTPAGTATQPGESDASQNEINIICNKQNPCAAEIHMTKDCSGSAVAIAQVDGVGTMTHTVKIIKIIDARYKDTTAVGSTVTLRKTG